MCHVSTWYTCLRVVATKSSSECSISSPRMSQLNPIFEFFEYISFPNPAVLHRLPQAQKTTLDVIISIVRTAARNCSYRSGAVADTATTRKVRQRVQGRSSGITKLGGPSEELTIRKIPDDPRRWNATTSCSQSFVNHHICRREILRKSYSGISLAARAAYWSHRWRQLSSLRCSFERNSLSDCGNWRDESLFRKIKMRGFTAEVDICLWTGDGAHFWQLHSNFSQDEKATVILWAEMFALCLIIQNFAVTCWVYEIITTQATIVNDYYGDAAHV